MSKGCFPQAFTALKIFGAWSSLLLLSTQAQCDPGSLRGKASLGSYYQLTAHPGVRTSGNQEPLSEITVNSGYLLNRLDSVVYSFDSQGELTVNRLPSTRSTLRGQVAGKTKENNVITYSIEAHLQDYAERILGEVDSPHTALVAMEPYTGRILALAGRSTTLDNAALHSGYKAASLFKLITSAAALENSSLRPNSPIHFRGGTYTLNKWNYKPSSKSDNRHMTFEEALAKSCNPVFARIALSHLDYSLLKQYAGSFGFNRGLDFQLPVSTSQAAIPSQEYELARTAAGFGDVHISPIHAATMMSGVANGGFLPKPILVEKIISPTGKQIYYAEPETLTRVMKPSTAFTLLEMMEATTSVGTSKREFYSGKRPLLQNIRVAGKTGTLRGSNPAGINNWFIGAAPLNDPKLVIAAVVVDPNHVSTKASRLARKMFEFYFTSS